MKKIYIITLLLTILFTFNNSLRSQSLPIGTVGIEDFYRRKQLLGQIDSNISFAIRPLFPSTALKIENTFDPDSSMSKNGYFNLSQPIQFAGGLGQFQILPFSWQQQYNSNHPYGWNDGPMIPSRGFQTMVSGGVFVKFGPLSIQLRPEFVSAQNKNFQGFADGKNDEELTGYYNLYNLIDAPEQFGKGRYTKASWGQSSIRLNVGPISFGLSNENIWWGPGIKNSLLMTNNAPGFKHLTLNTVKPIKTPIGSFEAQIIGGKLENTNYLPLSTTTLSDGSNIYTPYNPDWRYLAGMNISYQPKWIPGLFLGYIRDFMSYGEDLNGFESYFPFFFPVQKKTTGTQGDPFPRDQRIAMYARWLFPKAHTEVYFEYGVNDNWYNYRDFIGSPDHARAYIFGATKLISFSARKDEFIQINAEINQMSQSPDRLVRPAGGFYQHYQVRQGYTNLGQVLGAGTGSGGDLQSLDVSWVKGLKKFGISFERYEHDADLYNLYINDLNNESRRWVDYSIGAQGVWNYKNFVFSAKMQGIRSLNYQWRMKDYTPDEYYIPHNDVFNFHGELGVSFRF